MRILNCFNWKIKDIILILDDVVEQGFDTIQTNPLQPLKTDSLNPEWWQSYQPIGLMIGNQYGTKEELVLLCSEANKRNIKITVDVIITHLANEETNHLQPNKMSWYNNEEDKWKERKQIEDWNNRWQQINWCYGLPCLNLKNETVKKDIFTFLDNLLLCGVSGFRLDSCKSIGLPEEGVSILNEIKERYVNNGVIVYGEVIYMSDDYIDKYSKYMDVLTNYYSSWDKNKVVRFPESHDDFLGLNTTTSIPSHEIRKLYIKMLLEYKKMLFYTRPFCNEWKHSDIAEAHRRVKK